MDKPYEGKDPYVFVSYAHADDEVVLPIIDALEAGGYRVWYDARIEGGTVWTTNIANHVIGCQCMIAFVSEAATRSKYCNREIHLADTEGKDILPVHLDDSQLEPGMRLMIDLTQALFRSNFDSDQALVERLFREPILEPCLQEDVKARRDAVETASREVSSPRKNERGLRDALATLRGLEASDAESNRYVALIESRLKGLKAERGLNDALSVLRAMQDGDGNPLGEQHVGPVEDCLYWFEDERKRLAQEEAARRAVAEKKRDAEAHREEEARATAERERQEREERARREAEEARRQDEARRAEERERQEREERARREAEEARKAKAEDEPTEGKATVDSVRPRVFISYSWTSEKYQREVVQLACRLIGDGVDVVIDVWDLHHGNDKYAFMERCVTDDTIQKVLILCDKAYVQKANDRRGGVGDETTVITPELYGQAEQEKFIPVVMERDESGEAFLPAYLGSRLYVDLSGGNSELQYEDLLRSIFGVPRYPKPKPGQPPWWVYSGQPPQGDEEKAKKAAEVPVKSRLSEYNWAELKGIADEIAGARSDDEGLEVARRYKLVGADGRLGDERIPVTLADGRKAEVRIAGFRHDELADGGGRKAGITFEFADIPVRHAMNPSSTNAGGWEGSEMRGYLNGEFLKLLPEDLRSSIATVVKESNNVGGVSKDADVSKVVSGKADDVWLLSCAEVYGSVPAGWYRSDVYSAEGTQYQLYRDQGVSTSSYGFCVKKDGGAGSFWWLRSPCADYSYNFLLVFPDGDWGSGGADSEWGVSPGFCF